MAFTARELIESHSRATRTDDDDLERASVQPTDAPPRHGRVAVYGSGSTAQTPAAAPMPAIMAGRTFLHLQTQARGAP